MPSVRRQKMLKKPGKDYFQASSHFSSQTPSEMAVAVTIRLNTTLISVFFRLAWTTFFSRELKKEKIYFRNNKGTKQKNRKENENK